MATLTLARGADRDFLLQARDAAGQPFAAGASPFLGTDALAATVWPGADAPASFAPACAWSDPATGTFTVTASAAQTAALAAGVYRLRVTVTRAGKTGVLFDGRLALAAAPGSAPPPLAFTTRADLVEYAPWLEDLQGADDGLAFAAQQARATARLVDALVMLWQPCGDFGAATAGQPGFDAQSLFGGRRAPPSLWLRHQLVPLAPGSAVPASMAGNRLSTPANFVDPSVSTALLLYPEVKEICAKWAVGYVCCAQVGRDAERDWGRLANRFHADAAGLFRCRRFEVDLSDPQTGWASVSIDGGGGSLR